MSRHREERPTTEPVTTTRLQRRLSLLACAFLGAALALLAAGLATDVPGIGDGILLCFLGGYACGLLSHVEDVRLGRAKPERKPILLTTPLRRLAAACFAAGVGALAGAPVGLLRGRGRATSMLEDLIDGAAYGALVIGSIALFFLVSAAIERAMRRRLAPEPGAEPPCTLVDVPFDLARVEFGLAASLGACLAVAAIAVQYESRGLAAAATALAVLCAVLAGRVRRTSGRVGAAVEHRAR